MDAWGVGWAREGDRIAQVSAPGHGRRRCCYVDFLNTGPAVAATLRRRVNRERRIRRVSELAVTTLVTDGGRACGALAVALADGAAVDIAAGATVVATGGLTKLYARSSASDHMGGEGYALALRAGAELIDMEFVQFFPIGHLAPRLVGMDPIMWDPFRYKLGGRLLNGRMEEFIDRYGGEDGGRYTATRDVATYAIGQEVAAGRGSPHGGAYLSFTHLDESALRGAFGPVIDRLADNGIDLGASPVEVAPIAHYHMGGVRVDERMRTGVEGLLAAGEAVGGAGGANRLSGNAITEALVFGEVAGRSAGEAAVRARRGTGDDGAFRRAHDVEAGRRARPVPGAPPAVALLAELKELMWSDVGPRRDASGLERALGRIREMRDENLPAAAPRESGAFVNELYDWHELDAALVAAESVAAAALARQESRGAHQRSDHPMTRDGWARPQVVTLHAGHPAVVGARR